MAAALRLPREDVGAAGAGVAEPEQRYAQGVEGHNDDAQAQLQPNEQVGLRPINRAGFISLEIQTLGRSTCSSEMMWMREAEHTILWFCRGRLFKLMIACDPHSPQLPG